MTAHINIGSNLGDRAANIRRAARLVAQHIGEITAQSAIIETAAWGFDSTQAFMNQGVNVDTRLSPIEIVTGLQAIERHIAPEGRHRDSCGNYIDRIIDLDLICLDSIVSTEAQAIVPHPRMHQREFVLRPMVEILPQWRHPILNLTPQEMFDAIKAHDNALNNC